MSLFPAYSKDDSEPKETEPTPPSWLSNSSFKPPSRKSNYEKKQSSPSSSSHKRKKHKREKHEDKQRAEKSFFKKAEEKYHELLQNSSFREDRIPSRNNLLIPTLMKDDAPLYKKPRKCYYIDFSELKKKDKDWRYFKRSKKLFESDLTVTSQLSSQTNEEVLAVGNEDTVFMSTNLETQLSKTTASYNQQLTENPYDEDLWLQYIDFQDEIQHFEKYYRKTKGNTLASAEKKLAILDKALSHNPTSLALLNRKYEIKNEFFDAEKVSEELFADLRQDPGNIVLWNHYIRNTQCKLSRCSVPKVKSLYAKAMEKVNFIQKDGQSSAEKHLLDLYTTSALFLRQSGLWEQFLMLLRLNLQLNLTKSPSEDYRIPIDFADSNIQQMEDNMLTSGLPVYSLWLRIERLRQRVHWYPTSDPDCEDPQRVVVATDVTDLIKPITSRTLNLRIAALTMVLLKVPLIPLRDTVFRMLSLNDIEWQMDSAEILLSIFCSLGITQGRFTYTEESITSCFKDLVSYPQYINDELGREEYLEFVQNMFLKLSENLPFNCETIILVWWLRFERSLFIAGKQTQSRKKKLKNLVKNLLKDKHRSNLPLYIEYAFLEKEFNQNDDSCNKILETALLLYPIKKNFHSLTSKNCITQLYRVFVELLLLSGKKDRCLSLLTSLALSVPEKDITLNEITLTAALEEFQKITNQSFDEDYLLEEVFTFDHTEPQFFIEWIYCQAWFLYLTESVWSASVFLNELLHKTNYYEKGAPVYMGTYYRELITEILITLLHFHCNNTKSKFNVLNDSLLKGIKEFPNNILLLSTFADLETKLCFVSPWWKIDQCLRSNDSHVAKLILILLSRRKLILFEKASIESLKVLNQGGPVAASNAFSNQMRALLVKLVNDKNTRFCPLFWIIYLQYCAQYESDVKCKDVFYLAIESCPWIKTLYMEAAHALPDQVPQIQDLMIEKEIRIHITQDEIEILRDN